MRDRPQRKVADPARPPVPRARTYEPPIPTSSHRSTETPGSSPRSDRRPGLLVPVPPTATRTRSSPRFRRWTETPGNSPRSANRPPPSRKRRTLRTALRQPSEDPSFPIPFPYSGVRTHLAASPRSSASGWRTRARRTRRSATGFADPGRATGFSYHVVIISRHDMFYRHCPENPYGKRVGMGGKWRHAAADTPTVRGLSREIRIADG